MVIEFPYTIAVYSFFMSIDSIHDRNEPWLINYVLARNIGTIGINVKGMVTLY